MAESTNTEKNFLLEEALSGTYLGFHYPNSFKTWFYRKEVCHYMKVFTDEVYIYEIVPLSPKFPSLA